MPETSSSITAAASKSAWRSIGLFVLIASVSFILCVATSAYLYRTDRAARAWGATTWASSYGGIVRSDGMGYLAWTYSIADRDLCFAAYISETVPYQPQDASGFHLATGDGCFVPQYTLGQGVLWLPFVEGFRSIYAAGANGTPQSWVSKSSGLGIITGSAAIASIGLAALVLAFARRVRLWIAVLASVATFVGMYGFHYATFDAQFSHATSFGLFAVLVALVPSLRRAVTHDHGKQAIALGLAVGLDAGLIGLVRIPNLAIVAVFLGVMLYRPFLDALRLRQGDGPRLTTVIGSVAVLAATTLALLSFQIVTWHAATGQWFPQTYVGQGFTIGSSTPKILAEILLNPTWHGAVPWSPILIVAIAGFIFAHRIFRVEAMAAVAAIAVMLLTAATWSFPTGAGGLGLRFLIDVAPFIAIGVASCVAQARRAGPRATALAVAAVAICAMWSVSAMLGYWSARFPITGAPAQDLLRVVLHPHVF